MDIRYWMRAAAADLRHVWRTPGFARQWVAAGLRADGEPSAPVRDLLSEYPEIEELSVELGTVRYRRSNLDPLECFVIAAIVQLRKPRRIFEIGTYDGSTTLLLARSAPDAEVLTLDLAAAEASVATDATEAANALAGVGARFLGSPEAARITQLVGDSRQFDFSQWRGAVDLVVVDGGHEYATVRADTASAIAMLAPGGTAFWDDYTIGWPGVVRAIDESGLAVCRIAGTDLAVHTSPASATTQP